MYSLIYSERPGVDKYIVLNAYNFIQFYAGSARFSGSSVYLREQRKAKRQTIITYSPVHLHKMPEAEAAPLSVDN